MVFEGVKPHNILCNVSKVANTDVTATHAHIMPE